jgi:hypothetical protein
MGAQDQLEMSALGPNNTADVARSEVLSVKRPDWDDRSVVVPAVGEGARAIVHRHLARVGCKITESVAFHKA